MHRFSILPSSQRARLSISRWFRLIAAIFLLLSLAIPVRVQAAGIQAVVNRAQQNNNKTITFRLNAIGPAKIDRVILYFGIGGNRCFDFEQRREPSLDKGLQVNVKYEWDMETSKIFIPGREIWWQWEIYDAAGNFIETDQQRIVLEDTNYTWQKLEKEQITLYWSLGGLDFGKRLMEIASRSMTHLAENAGIRSPEKIRIIIYPSGDDMVDALPGVANWAGGIAYPDFNLVIIGISPKDSYQWPGDVMMHELAHLITEMGYTGCINRRLPLWLEEGLAEYAEGKMSKEVRELVISAVADDQLPALNTLSKSFPDDEKQAELAYAHSSAVVEYLVENQGVEKMNALLAGLRGGLEIDAAMRPVYGLDTDSLDQTWRAAEGFGSAPERIFVTLTPSPTITKTPTPDLSTATPTATLTPMPTTSPTSTALAPTTTPTNGGIIAAFNPSERTAWPGVPVILLFPAFLLFSGVGLALVFYLRHASGR